MAILFAGNEEADFDFVEVSDYVYYTSSSSYFDPAYSRVAVGVRAAAKAGKNVDPTSELWVASAVSKVDLVVTADYALYEILSATGPIARVVPTGSALEMALQRWDGAAWVTESTFVGFVKNETVVRGCLRAKTTVDGVLEFFMDGVLAGSYSGDLSALGAATQTKFGSIDSGVNDQTHHSEVMGATHDISSARLKALNLTAAGDLTAWAGAYTDVEAYDSADGTFISSGTAGQASTFQVANLAADTMDVAAVVLSGRVRRGATGPTGINGVVRIGTTNYTQSLGALGTAFEVKQAIWETDPSTTANWLRADVDALQVGVESVA